MELKTLDDKCVRCGACLGVCPVYKATLNERFSPRGKDHLLLATGLNKNRHLFIETIKACLQCGACSAVCTSGADVCSLIRKERGLHSSFRIVPHPVYTIFSSQGLSRFILRATDLIPFHESAGLSSSASRGMIKACLGAARILGPFHKPFLTAPNQWTGRYGVKTGHLSYKGPLPKMAFFVGCSQNLLFPQVAGKISAIFKDAMVLPPEQICCGLPAFSAGDQDRARKVIKQNLEAFEKVEFDFLLTGCASCASMIKKWPTLFPQGSILWRKSSIMAEKVMEFSQAAYEFLEPVNGLPGRVVSFQMPCHHRYDLARGDDPKRLLAQNLGRYFHENDLGCCGQGGLFGLSRPDLAEKIFKNTISQLDSDVEVIVTTCSGCLIGLRIGIGHLDHMGRRIAISHLVDTMVPG